MSSTNEPTDANGFLPAGIFLLGLTPVIMVLLPWDFGREMSFYRGFMRGNSLPVTLVEFAFVLLAMAKGFSPAASIAALPRLSKFGLLLFCGLSVWTTMIVAVSALFATLGMAKTFAHAIFALALSHQFKLWTNRQHQYIWPAIGWGLVGFCLLWAIDIAVYRPVGDDWVWLVPTLTNIRWIGFFALASFCAGLGTLVIASDGRIDRTKIKLPLLFIGFGLFLAIWTATRGAMLAILVATIAASYFSKDWKTVAGLTLVAAIFVSVLVWMLPNVHPIYGFERLFGSAAQYRDMNGVSSNRIQLWWETIQKIGVHPIVGWGIDQFRFSGPEATLGFRHPHQSILQLLFSTGLSGVIALYLVVFPLSRRLPISLSSPRHWAAGSYLLAGTIYGLHDGFFYYTYPVMIFIVSIVILVNLPVSAAASDKSG